MVWICLATSKRVAPQSCRPWVSLSIHVPATWQMKAFHTEPPQHIAVGASHATPSPRLATAALTMEAPPASTTPCIQLHIRQPTTPLATW